MCTCVPFYRHADFDSPSINSLTPRLNSGEIGCCVISDTVKMKRKFSGRSSRSAKRVRTYQPTGVGALVNAGINMLPAKYRVPARVIQASYKTASSLSKKYRSALNRKASSKVRRVKGKPGKAWFGMSTGYYKGKFRKTSRRGAKNAFDKYMNYGFVSTKEVFGKVDDADCVYLGHSTWDVNELSRSISYSLVRKLVKKAGFDPDQPTQELPFYAYNDSDGFKIAWTRISVAGIIQPTEYVIPNDATVTSVAENSGLRQQIQDTMDSEFQGSNRGNWDRIALYSSDRNGVSTNWRLAAELNLKREVLDVMVKSEFTVQNRTKSAVAGSSSTDIIDNQPLKGYLYQFAGAVPQTKQMGTDGLNRISFNGGIILQQSVDLNPSTLYKEPPVPKFFNNCYKASYVSLDPGYIKKSVVVSKWRGYFNNLISGKLMARTNGSLVSYAPGKCQLFALEERLNSGSTNLITVNYECDRKIGAVFYTTKNPSSLSDYESLEINNVTVV